MPSRLPITRLALTALALTGCLLDEEECGDGFALSGGRCVPLAAVADASVAPGVVIDAATPTDPEPPPSPPAEGWGGYVIVALLDQTPEEVRRADPGSPGPEIDAVIALPGAGDFRQAFGVGVEVLESPRGDAVDLVGPPDGRAVSLGALGGRVFIELALSRPFESGDAIGVIPGDVPGQREEAFSVFLCQAPLNAMEGCRKVGDGDETMPFVVLP